jgi:hypothetical protein
VDDDAGRGLVHVPLVLVQDPAHQAGGVLGGQVRRAAAGLVRVPVEVVAAQDQALAVLVKRLHEAGLHRGEAAVKRARDVGQVAGHLPCHTALATWW